MAVSHFGGSPDGRRVDQFETTHWSVVLAAGVGTTPESKHALTALCERYWGPLYAYVRRRGYDVPDAQDITQGFFADLLERSSLKAANPDRGKFRAYLLTALKHYLSNEQRQQRAEKRGGGVCPLSLDFDSAEGRYRSEPADASTPESIYERQWAMNLLTTILIRLTEEHASTEKRALFDRLRPCMTGEETAMPYRQLAAELAMSEGAVKVAIHRLRKRFGELLRQEIAQTVAGDAEVEQEIRDLFAAIR